MVRQVNRSRTVTKNHIIGKQVRTSTSSRGWWQRRAKYNNSKSVYGGHLYDSSLEARYAQLLDWRKRGGDIKDWRRQIPFLLPPKEVPTPERRRRITLDFEEILNDGSSVFTEIKGYPTEAFGVRWAWFRREYPNLKTQLISIVRLPFEATK